MADFGGKTAIVTGASSGIGVGIASTLAGLGAKVALVARSQGRLAAVADQIHRDGGTCAQIAVDVSADGAADEIVAQTIREFGSLDVLVHNAGIFRTAPLIGSDIRDLDDQ